MNSYHHHKDRGLNHLHKHEKFKMILKNCAKGARGKISLIKRRSDHTLLIWKRPKSDSHIYQESYKKEIKKIAKWRNWNLTNIKVCWCNNKKDGILKTYVEGPTLRQYLRHHEKFFSSKHSHDNRQFKDLKKFVRLLVKSRSFVHDIKGGNIIWDRRNKRWQLIDSGPIHKKSSKSALKKQYRNVLKEKWSSLIPRGEKHNLEEFLKENCS